MAAAIGPVVALVVGVWGHSGLWNDFASYWLAGKLVAAGHSPYDLVALARLGAKEGLAFQAGTGYSYPLPFAVFMVPLGALPFPVAGALFSAASVVVFAWAVAGWLADPRLGPVGHSGAFLAALLAGFYPPVTGSAFFGQANLLVLGPLAFGVRRWIGSDVRADLWGGVAIGLAGIVKVAPLALVIPAGLARRLGVVSGVVLGAAGAMAAAVLLAPTGIRGAGRLGELGAPDPYWTNQSLNGFISRLTVENERTSPFLRGSIDPRLAAWLVLGVFAALTLAVLWRARERLGAGRGLLLAIGFTLVAAVIGAPKDSFWNQVPALIGIGLFLAAARSGDGLDRVAGGLLLAWYGLAVVQVFVDSLHGTTLHAMGPVGAVLSSAAVYSLLILWFVLGRALLRRSLIPTAAAL